MGLQWGDLGQIWLFPIVFATFQSWGIEGNTFHAISDDADSNSDCPLIQQGQDFLPFKSEYWPAWSTAPDICPACISHRNGRKMSKKVHLVITPQADLYLGQTH